MGSHLQRSLSAQVNGGPDATTDRGKQPISADRVLGGSAGNVEIKVALINYSLSKATSEATMH